MKDLYDLLPIYSNPVFEHQEIVVEDINNQNKNITDSEDLFHANYHNLEGSGIFDSILNIGKKLIGVLPTFNKVTSDFGKTISSSSDLYHAVKDFNKPKTKPAPKTTKKIDLTEIENKNE